MDPSVLLRAYKSPQWPDPIEEYKGFLSLRQMMDLGKLRQVQLKQNELENLQKQRDLDEYEMYRRGVSQLPANATLDQTIQALGPKYGAAHFKLTHEAQTALNQQRAAESAQAEAKLKLGRTQGQSLADMMYANSLLPEKDRQADWDTAWGGIPVDLPPTQDEVQAQIARGYGGEKQQAMAIAKTAAENAADKAAFDASLRPFQARKSIAEANTAEQVSTGTQPLSTYQRRVLENQEVPDNLTKLEIALANPKLSPEMRAQLQAARPALIEQENRRHPGAMVLPGYAAVGTPATAQLTGDEFLKTLSPAAASEIRAMAEGRIVAPTAQSRAAGAQQKLAALMQYDPAFTTERAGIRKAFSTGKQGDNIRALNTATVHLGRLADASEALKNGTFRPGNEAYQYFANMFGSGTVSKFELLKDAVAGEMASALKGTATDIEIANMKHSINIANSPEQMRDAVMESISVLGDKLNTYTESYRQRSPEDTVWSPVLPSARATMQRFGVGAGGQQKQTPATQAQPTHRFNPATGKAEPIR